MSRRRWCPGQASPTQAGPAGLRFDFNGGARVNLPEAGGPWQVRLSDIDTGNVLYETSIPSGWVSSAKRYYLRVRIEVRAAGELVLAHDYDCRDREVLIQFPVGTLGGHVSRHPVVGQNLILIALPDGLGLPSA